MSEACASQERHRFPLDLIAHAVWLYFRFPPGVRPIEAMLVERGILVSYDTLRRGSRKFGVAFARSLRRKPAKRGDIWHLDEVRIVICGKPHGLWRAVDRDGHVLDEILLTRLPARQGARPGRMVTDKPCPYGAARRKLTSSIRHLSHEGLNSRAENSRLPPRKRERIMQQFRSPGTCQRVVSVFPALRNLFVPPASIDSSFSRYAYRVQAPAQ